MQSKMAKEKRLVLIIKFVIRGKKAQLTSQFTDSTTYNKKIQFPCIATSMTMSHVISGRGKEDITLGGIPWAIQESVSLIQTAHAKKATHNYLF